MIQIGSENSHILSHLSEKNIEQDDRDIKYDREISLTIDNANWVNIEIRNFAQIKTEKIKS